MNKDAEIADPLDQLVMSLKWDAGQPCDDFTDAYKRRVLEDAILFAVRSVFDAALAKREVGFK